MRDLRKDTCITAQIEKGEVKMKATNLVECTGYNPSSKEQIEDRRNKKIRKRRAVILMEIEQEYMEDGENERITGNC